MRTLRPAGFLSNINLKHVDENMCRSDKNRCGTLLVTFIFELLEHVFHPLLASFDKPQQRYQQCEKHANVFFRSTRAFWKIILTHSCDTVNCRYFLTEIQYTLKKLTPSACPTCAFLRHPADPVVSVQTCAFVFWQGRGIYGCCPQGWKTWQFYISGSFCVFFP